MATCLKRCALRLVAAARGIATVLLFVFFGIGTLLLAPLMLVAGDHALNDLAGEEPDSWKSLLEAEGYDVACRLEGIGTGDEVAARYCVHLKAALEE